MAFDALFVLGFGMTSDGVAYGTLVAETSAALLGLAIARREFGRMRLGFDRARVFDRPRLLRTLAINRDIMIRSLSLVFAFSWFTARSAKLGDVPLAANAVLMHFFEMSAFLIDGFAYASEALVGQAIGARDRKRFEAAIWLTSIWAGVVGTAAHRPDDGITRGSRLRPRLRDPGRAHPDRWNGVFSVRRHFHRRHADGRHAQHDDRVAGDFSRRVGAARARLRQPRAMAGDDRVLRGARRDLRPQDAGVEEAGVRVTRDQTSAVSSQELMSDY
jgi:hypothetical protein